MRVLINESFKALRTGQYVTAAEEAGEFILDTENCDFTIATLEEVVRKNELSAKGKNKTALLSSIETEFIRMKLPEQNTMSDSQKVLEIVTAGVAAGLDDDDMLMKLITKVVDGGAGIRFGVANKMFKAAMEEGGFRAAMGKVKEDGRQILIDAEYEPSDYDSVTAMVDKIVAEISGANNIQAIKVVKAYCKEFEMEVPKAPKKVKGPLLQRVMTWLVKNPNANAEDLSDVLAEQKQGEKVIARYVELLEFANQFASAQKVEIEEQAAA